MLQTLKGLVLVAVASLSLASCTISEPETSAGDASNMRLKAVKWGGMNMMSFKYDAQNRVTKIVYSDDITYELTYEGSNRIPVKVVTTEYGYEYVNGKDVRVVDEIDTWTNIKANSFGCIASVEVHEITNSYSVKSDYDGNETLVKDSTEEDDWWNELKYDSAGHLIQEINHNSDGSRDINDYTWKNNLLTYSTDNDPDWEESISYEYSEVENIQGQWDPNNRTFGPLAITGLVGKAPSHFIKTEKYYYQGRLESNVQYSYSLLSNGLINAGKYYDSEEGEMEMVLNFVYEKVK